VKPREPRVFVLEPEAGELRFGDGIRGARLPLGAMVVADYEYSEGREGNVNAGAIKTSSALPAGFSVTNPVRTWGGADAETVEQGEKQVQRYVQHHGRLVTADDFATVAWRTPGVEIGRIDVIPAASPQFGRNEPGDAPGAVTLLVVPLRDPAQPDAPRPDRLFLDAICSHIDPWRLVATEVFLRGPQYKNVWLSVAIDVAAGRSIAEVRQAVEAALRAALSPLPPPGTELGPDALLPVFTPPPGGRPQGWPLRKPVVGLELAAVAARVPGVTAVRELLLGGDTDTSAQASIDMRGLELPRLAGIAVGTGEAVPLSDLRGAPGTGGPATGVGFVPLPVVPEEC
jgi:predicted phage baseplate assembly protein